MRTNTVILLTVALGLGCPIAALAGSGIVESSTDLMNACQTHQRSCDALRDRGVRILNISQEHSFAVTYKPQGYASGRILVLLHGTHGAAYDEVKDELDMADAYDLMLVGIQWLDLETETYYDPSKVYAIIGNVLAHIREADGNPLTAVALSGFSRGSAISYEVAWRDLQAHRYFDLVIAHSGAIPSNARIEQKNPGPVGEFYSNLIAGKLGEQAYAGAHFFLYAGEKDEGWGTQMAEYMRFTRDLLGKSGADIVACIIDPDGKHRGYRTNPEYHERSIRAFLSLTGSEPVPVRPLRAADRRDGPERRQDPLFPPRRRQAPPR